MKEGKRPLKSMDQLAFGPEAILFVADTKAARIVAIATGDTTPATGRQALQGGRDQPEDRRALGTTAIRFLSMTWL